MTREEAIKRIEEHMAHHHIGEYPAIKLGEALGMAIAALREQPRWISVEERLPERRGHYFIAYKFADSDMRFYGEAMWHDDISDNGYVQGNHFSNEGMNGMRVTHWMEIPTLPPEGVK